MRLVDQELNLAYAPVTAPSVKEKKRWLLPTLVGVGAFIVGTLVGSAGSGATTSATGPEGSATVTLTAPAQTVTEPGEATATVTASAKPATTVTVTENVTGPPPESPSDISDGQFEVGTDIKAGRWKTTTKAEDNGSLCYADVQFGSDYLAQEATPKGYTIVNVPTKKGAIFTSRGCGSWKKLG